MPPNHPVKPVNRCPSLSNVKTFQQSNFDAMYDFHVTIAYLRWRLFRIRSCKNRGGWKGFWSRGRVTLKRKDGTRIFHHKHHIISFWELNRVTSRSNSPFIIHHVTPLRIKNHDAHTSEWGGLQEMRNWHVNSLSYSIRTHNERYYPRLRMVCIYYTQLLNIYHGQKHTRKLTSMLNVLGAILNE